MKVQLDSNVLINGSYCVIGEVVDLADKQAEPLLERGLVHKVEAVDSDSSLDAILEEAVTTTTKRRKRG